jgi:xanthine dehydrogenase molybdopterin-binding subunit B
VKEAYLRRVPLAAYGYYRTPEIHYDRAKGRGRPFYYFACGSAVTEVEVNPSTGMARLLRVDILHDVGESLNPAIDRGQIEGGFIQGFGWLTSEEVVWNDKGHLLSHGASTYEIPTIGDAPAEFHVHLLENAAQPGTIHGSKAVGEPPLMLAISAREAIRDAVANASGRSEEILLGSPATCEAIFRSIHAMEPSADAGRRLVL